MMKRGNKNAVFQEKQIIKNYIERRQKYTAAPNPDYIQENVELDCSYIL